MVRGVIMHHFFEYNLNLLQTCSKEMVRYGHPIGCHASNKEYCAFRAGVIGRCCYSYVSFKKRVLGVTVFQSEDSYGTTPQNGLKPLAHLVASWHYPESDSHGAALKAQAPSSSEAQLRIAWGTWTQPTLAKLQLELMKDPRPPSTSGSLAQLPGLSK